MNKLAVITGFLGEVRNRYMQYQPDRALQDKFAVADRIEGLDGLELCYPGDFGDLDLLRALLDERGWGIAAVNYRSRRTGQWLRGSFTSSDPAERQALVDDCRRAIDLAAELGCYRITTCPLNEGHDYPFEADYRDLYRYAEETFAAVCAHNPEVRICIEYKWNDPRGSLLVGRRRRNAGVLSVGGRAQPGCHAGHRACPVWPRASRPVGGHAGTSRAAVLCAPQRQ
jgi:xylose isomerase